MPYRPSPLTTLKINLRDFYGYPRSIRYILRRDFASLLCIRPYAINYNSLRSVSKAASKGDIGLRELLGDLHNPIGFSPRRRAKVSTTTGYRRSATRLNYLHLFVTSDAIFLRKANPDVAFNSACNFLCLRPSTRCSLTTTASSALLCSRPFF